MEEALAASEVKEAKALVTMRVAAAVFYQTVDT